MPRRLALLLLVGLCGSCGAPGRPLYPVVGRVLVDGQPAAHACVTFHPEDRSGPDAINSFARAGADGTFAATTYRTHDGVPAGTYVLTVEWRAASGLYKDQFEGPDALHGRYADPKQSTLRFEVKPGTNEVPPIELTTEAKK